MLRWLTEDSSRRKQPEVFQSVVQGLQKYYKDVILPLEETYDFHAFHSPPLDTADFSANPMILLVGQYSTGKTTFIRYLLEQDFPGIRIGPEPTTDRFIAIMHGDKDQVIPGNALVVDPTKQFRKLSRFGNSFLNRLQCSQASNPVLESVTIVDTPGILSGEKQRVDRGYDFVGVLEWFAERADRIILLFDAHKLDISDEFRRSIEALKGNEDKVRIVLNKADMIDSQQLMRVYGALMWSLGKVLQTPEVTRVFIGSFWTKPLQFDDNRKLFEAEARDLFNDLQSLPRNAALRKLNDLIKRARLAKVHAYVISELHEQMPSMFGKDSKKARLIDNLHETYALVEKKYGISPGDFPPLGKMREILKEQDFKNFNKLRVRLIEKVDNMLANGMTRLMEMIPHEEEFQKVDYEIRGGAFSHTENSPFAEGAHEGLNYGKGELTEWVVEEKRDKYDRIFDSLDPVDNMLAGQKVKKKMQESKLPNTVLGRIWKLADVDRDGKLDREEFALAFYLIDEAINDVPLSAELPQHLVPPSKRHLVAMKEKF